jgi:hypothetical protein
VSTFLVVALLSATAPVKVAAPGLAGTDVSPELLAFVNERLSQQLTLEGLEMMSSAPSVRSNSWIVPTRAA